VIGPKAIIHLDRLLQNLKHIKEHIGNHELMVVVKANAYGHGAVPVTKALAGAGVNWFAVFTPEEGVELRNAGITQKILVFSRLNREYFHLALEQNFILNCSCIDDLHELKAFHAETGKSPEVHFKIDTGMTRLGASPEEYPELFRELKESPEIRCTGIYSHFATADEGDLSYAEYQLDRFKKAVDLAADYGITFKHVHLSNSGTILNLPESYFNIVRVGMLLYGALPSDEVPEDVPVQPVMEFVGPVVNVRRVKKGTKVSYGGVWSAPEDTNIGVIQTGFADGFPRPWYEGGSVLYKGHRYAIAGRACMDQLMVDFENTVPVLGEHVLFFGENRHGQLKVEEIAKAIDQTTYTLLTAIHGRTERIFI